MTMERYFDAQFLELRDQLLRMSYLSVESFSTALEGLFQRDRKRCEEVIAADHEIDQLEVRNDQSCVDLLLRLQPVAKDLRFVIMSMKINTNLERLGDQAVYIARVGCDLADLPPTQDFFGLPELGERVKAAIKDAVDAYMKEDADLARRVRAGDGEINRLHREMIQQMLRYMMENPSRIAQAVELIFLARALERAADYGKNIAEEVIYLVDAVDPRHRS